MFRCECSIYNSTIWWIAIWNRFVTSADFWLVSCFLKMHSWLEIKCQTECNNDYDKNKGHAYRFLCYLTFSFRTSNWNNHDEKTHFRATFLLFWDFHYWCTRRMIWKLFSNRHFQYLLHYRSTSIIKMNLDRYSKWSFETILWLAEMLKKSDKQS